MKKNNLTRILPVVLMLCLTFAIPLTASTQAHGCALETDVAESTIVAADDASPTISSENEDLLTNFHPAKELSVSRDPGDCYLPIDAAPANSGCSYCGSQYHSYNYCAQRSVDNGAAGRWVVPSVGINVAVYNGSGYGGTLSNQEICDRWDSAAYYFLNGMSKIADHSNQEFSALKYVSVGMNAYMDYGSYRQKYVCPRFEYGHNDIDYLYDADYNPLDSNYNPGGITCYTCNGNWRDIILASFQPVYD